MIRMHDLNFAMKTHSDGVRFVILAILRVEKCWTKVRTNAITYSPIVSACFQIQIRLHHEAAIIHRVTTLQASLPI